MAEVPLLNILTEEEVQAAERLEGPYAKHPVTLALDRHSDQIRHLVEGYFSIKEGHPGEKQARLAYLTESAPFLVNIFTEASPFELGSLNLITIWSRVMQLFPDETFDPEDHNPPYHRYTIARLLSTVHAVQGAGERWKQFPLVHLTDHKIPEECLEDRQAAKTVFDNLQSVKSGIEEIEYYLAGTRQDFTGLLNGMLRGDPAARRDLALRDGMIKQRKTFVLSQLIENVGGGLVPAHSLVGRLLAA